MEVFEVRDPVIYFLQLVLRVSLELPPDAINKWLRLPQVFPQKGLELYPDFGDLFLTFLAMFELCPVHTNIPMKKRSCKRSLVGPDGFGVLEIIFALLTEVITVHMQLIILYLWYLSLKGLFALCWRLSRYLVCLQVGLHKFFEQFIGSNQSRTWSKNQSGNQSRNQIGAWGRVTRWSGRGTIWTKTSN